MITNLIIEKMGEVPEDAFIMENPQSEDIHYPTGTSHPENNYVSEIKTVLCTHSAWRSKNFQIHLDKSKYVYERIRKSELLNQFESLRYRSGEIRPDLIIHKSQSDTNPTNQIFSMECKIAPNLNYEKFRKDLFKLMIYKEILKFQENLYLIANNRNEKISEFLERYQSEGMFFSDSGILILNIEEYGAVPELIFSNF
jgi:hypothetical protein